MTRWLERLTNWQFVAVVAAFTIAVLTAGTYVMYRFAGQHIDLRVSIILSIVFTVIVTATQAWRRWK